LADVRPSLSITGAAVDAPADAVPLLRRAVREHGVTAVQVNLSEASAVRVEVFDLSGRLLWQLDTGGQAPGMYVFRWSGTLQRGGQAPPGVYLAVIWAQGRRAVSRFVLTSQDRR
jgi:flagellar hook assembly protein FlgD